MDAGLDTEPMLYSALRHRQRNTSGTIYTVSRFGWPRTTASHCLLEWARQ